MEEVTRVVAMIKENGEAGHVSVRVIGDQFYFIAGSKNVHLVFRTAQDLELYTDSRYRNFKLHALYFIFHFPDLRLPRLLERPG